MVAERATATSRCRRRSRRCSPRGSTSSTAAERGVSSAARSRARSSTAARSQALAPDEPQSTATLSRSSARTSSAPSSRSLSGGRRVRFRHLLIRDAAYEALPKAARAELHERFADWLARAASTGRARGDPRLPPRAGVPLPRGARPARRPAAALAEQAATRLLAGGDHALERGDGHAVIRLLSRALALLPPADPRAPSRTAQLARALSEQAARWTFPHTGPHGFGGRVGMTFLFPAR